MSAFLAMAPGARKFTLAVHLACSVGWLGAAMSYLAVGIVTVRSSDVETVRSGWIAMELMGWYVIVPLAVGSLVTGCVMGLGTRWGLFRHYWVAASLALTFFATVVLVLHMPTVSTRANLARGASAAELGQLGGDVLHPGIGVGVLGFVLGLNVVKPRGMTRYGQRKQYEERRRSADGSDAERSCVTQTRVSRSS
ncbi:MAG: DUF2269 domain-containing protein [Actinomycetota bacterium]